MIEMWIEAPGLRIDLSGVERAARSALSRSLKGMKADARRKVAERYVTGLVSGTLKTRQSGLSGRLTSEGARNPIERFKINPRRRINPGPAGGVYASVVKGQGGNIRRGFIQSSGGVYERVGKSRFPIKRLKSVSAPQMIGYRPISEYIIEKAAERFMKNFNHAAAYFGGVK